MVLGKVKMFLASAYAMLILPTICQKALKGQFSMKNRQFFWVLNSMIYIMPI